MKRFIFAILSLGLLHVYVGYRIADRWPAAQEHAGSFWLCVLLFFMTGLVAPLFEVFVSEHYEPKPARKFRWLDRLSYLTLGVFSCLLLYTLAADVLSLLWQVLWPPEDMAAYHRHVLLGLVAFTALTTAIGVYQAVVSPSVCEVEVALDNLPPAFDGFKIVQISDLHIGPTLGRAYAEKTVRIAGALKPDLIALTGDFVDGDVVTLQDDIAPLQNLRAPQGVYYVTGNHEYYWDAEGWSAYFKSIGIYVFNNTHKIIAHNGEQIVLAGVTDYSTRHLRDHPHASSPHKAIAGAPEGLVKILLAHQPVSYKEAEPAGFDLQLSGHTHAGQYFPYSLVIRFFQKYYKGLNRHGRLQVYVNRGTGYWGPPLRTLVQGEITLLRLRRKKAGT
jgi:predicted MPP superfamily phosphohydrolase